MTLCAVFATDIPTSHEALSPPPAPAGIKIWRTLAVQAPCTLANTGMRGGGNRNDTTGGAKRPKPSPRISAGPPPSVTDELGEISVIEGGLYPRPVPELLKPDDATTTSTTGAAASPRGAIHDMRVCVTGAFKTHKRPPTDTVTLADQFPKLLPLNTIGPPALPSQAPPPTMVTSATLGGAYPTVALVLMKWPRAKKTNMSPVSIPAGSVQSNEVKDRLCTPITQQNNSDFVSAVIGTLDSARGTR